MSDAPRTTDETQRQKIARLHTAILEKREMIGDLEWEIFELQRQIAETETQDG